VGESMVASKFVHDPSRNAASPASSNEDDEGTSETTRPPFSCSRSVAR